MSRSAEVPRSFSLRSLDLFLLFLARRLCFAEGGYGDLVRFRKLVVTVLQRLIFIGQLAVVIFKTP
jgi:hypothetical protein